MESGGGVGLFQNLESGLENAIEAAADLGELVCEPGQDWDAAKCNDAQIELPSEFIRFGVGDATKDGVAMHLGEEDDEAGAYDAGGIVKDGRL